MKRETIQAKSLKSIAWFGDSLVDWVNEGKVYIPGSSPFQIGKRSFEPLYNSVITSRQNDYTILYKRLGVEGLLLKNQEILRKIRRANYQADVYEYPVAFWTAGDNKTYLIHCPNEYNKIEMEDVETGEVIASRNDQEQDFFHSRFEVSPDNILLLSKGWFWHPSDFIKVFNLEKFKNGAGSLSEIESSPSFDVEICAASFIDSNSVLVGIARDAERFDISLQENSSYLAIWDLKSNKIADWTAIDFDIGSHLSVIDDTFAWDLYKYPKVINYREGTIVDKAEDIFSGTQLSSIIHHLTNLPKIAFKQDKRKVAIADNERIEILSWLK